MTCQDVTQLLKREGREGAPCTDYGALALHLKGCRRCSEALKVVALSSALLQTLREETGPGPTFYPRLRARLADTELSRPDMGLLHALGLAKRLIPALAVGVLLLAGVTLPIGGSRSSLPVQVRGGTDVNAFSLEEVNLPGVVGEPTRDQMLAFVLRQDDVRGPSPSLPLPMGEGRGEGEVQDESYDRDTR
ncbi:MAG: hypothetical protein KGL31_08695 [candidate division NC10 bacterium]|nr:hypothetical protein [candidate division NC10 bacterium]MDE2321975.1 hypothetical protein [candidate division NC10 bacterium]